MASVGVVIGKMHMSDFVQEGYGTSSGYRKHRHTMEHQES